MKSIYIYFLSLFLFSLTVPASASHYIFKELSLKEGIPAQVKCIEVDYQGIVWIGSKYGLQKLDGYQVKAYPSQQNNEFSLPSNRITAICEDEQKNLWVVTYKGLALYLRNEDKFQQIEEPNGQKIVASSCCPTSTGVFFGGRGKLYFYSYHTQTIQLMDIKIPENYNISQMVQVSDDELLCSNRWKGTLTVHLKEKRVSEGSYTQEKEIMSLYVDSQHRIWISPYKKGAWCFNDKGILLEKYNTDNSDISGNIILCMMEKDGQLWMGTDGEGISIFHLNDKKFTHLRHLNHKNTSTLPAQTILCFYRDRQNIWAGSLRNGLISIRPAYMQSYGEVPLGNSSGLSNNTVLSIFKDKNDKLWIGTDGGGINEFNPETRVFNHIRATANEKITSICKIDDRRLLYSIFSKGLYTIDVKTGEKKRITIINPETDSRLCSSGKSIVVHNFSPESILIMSDSLILYKFKENQFESIPTEDKSEGALQLIEELNEKIYLHDSRHILELDKKSHKIKNIYATHNDTTINAASIDENHLMWIGTNYGLITYHLSEKKREPLASPFINYVTMILCDRKGKVWIGTNTRLFAWLINEKRLLALGESDGASINEYLARPRAITDKGDIILGGVQGLLQIDHTIQFNKADKIDFALSELKLNGNNIYTLRSDHMLTIPWNGNLEISVRTAEEDIFREKLYKYAIEGENGRQEIKSYNPTLFINALAPGSYSIKVSCSTKDGGWTEAYELLKVKVTPQWYKSGWFFTLLLIAVIAAIAALFQYRLKKKERKIAWQMKEHKQQLYEEKVKFLINISHELRTPLTLIYAPLHQLMNSIDSSDSRFSSVRSLFRQAERMKNIINMVLDLRKMELGENTLHIDSYLLNNWINSVMEDFSFEAEKKGIKLSAQFDNTIEYVDFDKEKTQIILSNLLINALKHSKKGEHISIVTQKVEDKVRIEVKDEGTGISVKEIEKLFNRFYQGDNEKEGSGIGLAYSKILVEQQGGYISAENNPVKGANFFFYLPLRHTADHRKTVEHESYINELMNNSSDQESLKDNSFDTKSYTLLIVEDNRDLIDFIRDNYTDKFKKIYSAENGEDGLLIARQYTPDIIITDVMMPKMDGYELCRAIKEDINISHIPVIMLTARTDKQSRLAGYKLGADGYITKPFELEMLYEIISNRLKEREKTRERYLKSGTIPIPQETTISETDENLLINLNKIISDNLNNKELTVPYLCQELGMSKASLYNKLKILTDMGANEYINKFRIEKAAVLIATTDKSFTEIADMVGFNSSRYFSTVFKQFCEMTPSQYREMHQQPK